MNKLEKLRDWQRRMHQEPAIWGVYVHVDGVQEFTGNVYASREAAQLEADWQREHGYKSARVCSLGNVHSLELAKERWLP